MVDSEKRENLANARRKLKKFRDQNQTNGNDVHSTNGTSVESPINYNIMPLNEQQSILNGTHQNLSKSPVTELEEQNRQYALLIENQKQQRSHLENQRQLSGGSNMSGRSSQTSLDVEQKLRRDVDHLQEQLEIHVQTIGILVAEKTDVSAKLTQSFKQLERKQSEMDELHGRLKASRERVQELEKQMQNSTSNVQKREMAAKESDKENDRLKIENIRQSQTIEDLKQNINELNEKLHNRQNLFDQLNSEIEQLRKPTQTVSDQQDNQLQQTISLQNNQIEEHLSTINRMRSDNEQYQQYNTNMQQHILELNNQINQLIQTNNILQTEHDSMKKTYENKLSDHNSIPDHDNLQQENLLFRNAIDQWSNRYEELRIKLEQTTKLLNEKDEYIVGLKTNDSIDKNQLVELQEEYNKMSNENLNLTNQLQTIQKLNERLPQTPSKSNHEQETQTNDQQTDLSSSLDSIDDHDSQQKLIERFNRAMHENAELKDRIQNLEHVILQLQSETETIGDYIYLYQQQREQLQRRYQEKDDYITQLTQDRFNLQKKVSELEILMVRSLNIPIKQSELNEQSEISTTDQSTDKTPSLPQLSDDTKARMLALIKELGQNNVSSPQNDKQSEISTTGQRTDKPSSLPQLSDDTKARILGQNNVSSPQNDSVSTVKLAFIDRNLYICSGPVQWV